MRGSRDVHRRVRRGVAWAALVAGLVASASASAQVPGEENARRAFEDGVALEKKSDFAGALAKFKESSAIKPTLGNRFHIAYCLEMTGKLAAAFVEYEIVERGAREQSKAELLESTRVRLEPLRTKVPQLALRATGPLPPDAMITLDGASVATALVDGKPFRIDPGEHTITAQAPDHDTFKKQLTAPEGAVVSVDITLHKNATAHAPPPASAHPARNDHVTEPPAELASSRSYTLPIVTTAGAAVLAGGGVVAFVLAGGAQSDAEKICPTKPTCEDEKSQVRTLDALALAGFIGGAGLAALSIVLWTSGGGEAERHGRLRSPALVRVQSAGSWIGIEGRF